VLVLYRSMLLLVPRVRSRLFASRATDVCDLFGYSSLELIHLRVSQQVVHCVVVKRCSVEERLASESSLSSRYMKISLTRTILDDLLFPRFCVSIHTTAFGIEVQNAHFADDEVSWGDFRYIYLSYSAGNQPKTILPIMSHETNFLLFITS
jgi:hypothetical protein